MNKFKLILIIILLFAPTVMGLYGFSLVKSQEDVTIEANVGSCILEVKVYPEKRIPATGNWDTFVTAELYLSETNFFVGSITVESNQYGNATFQICEQGFLVSDADYDLYLRGASHLFRYYGSFRMFDDSLTFLDLKEEPPLLAGETSIRFDNFINTLDVSTQITRLETVDYINDLNQDGEVNILDLSNTITNYLISGDCSPQQRREGVCT